MRILNNQAISSFLFKGQTQTAQSLLNLNSRGNGLPFPVFNVTTLTPISKHNVEKEPLHTKSKQSY